VDNIQTFYQTNEVEAHSLYIAKELGLLVTDQLMLFVIYMTAYQVATYTTDLSELHWLVTDIKRFLQDGGEIALGIMEKVLHNLRKALDDAKRRSGKAKDPSKLKGCQYHDHEEGKCHRL